MTETAKSPLRRDQPEEEKEAEKNGPTDKTKATIEVEARDGAIANEVGEALAGMLDGLN